MTFILIEQLLWRTSWYHKEKNKLFAKYQESIRKDVEIAFGVLKSWFAIIYDSSCNWHIDAMKNIMIVKDEQDTYNSNINIDYDNVDKEILNIDVSRSTLSNFVIYLQIK